MPYINIRLGTALDSIQRDQLYDKTTTLMNTLMGKRPEVTVVHIQESDPQLWSTNAITLTAEAPTAAYVDIKVTEGTNTPEEKAEMLSQTVKMLHDVVGAVQRLAMWSLMMSLQTHGGTMAKPRLHALPPNYDMSKCNKALLRTLKAILCIQGGFLL